MFSKLNKNCLANFPSIVYLCAISFHNRGPSSTSASEVSHMTINWNVSWPKHQRVHLALGHPLKKCTRKQKFTNFRLNNISFSHYVHISFELLSTCVWHNMTGQHDFRCFYDTVRIGVLPRELYIYFYFFLEMDFTVAKTLTFAFEIFRCKTKQGQLKIQNNGKNLNKWMLEVKNASHE